MCAIPSKQLCSSSQDIIRNSYRYRPVPAAAGAGRPDMCAASFFDVIYW